MYLLLALIKKFMSRENPFSNSDSNKEAEKEEQIIIVSVGDYLKATQENTVKKISEEERLKEFRSDADRFDTKAQKIVRGREDNRRKEYIKNDFIEEIGFFQIDKSKIGVEEPDMDFFEKFNSAYFSNIQNGFKVETFSVYNEKDEFIGLKMYRERPEVINQKIDIKDSIDSEYENSNETQWFFSEQEREKELKEKVKNGEMVYLGEFVINSEEFKKITKEIPSENTELTWIFDKNKRPTREKTGVYAKLK